MELCFRKVSILQLLLIVSWRIKVLKFLLMKRSDLAFVGYDGKWRLEKGDFKIKCGDQWLDIQCEETKIWDTPNK